MKPLLRLVLTFCALFSTELFAGNLKINITPAAAVTAGAQWRVDGGTWRNSGATVSNLTDTSHQIDFKIITGWVTPAAVAKTLSSGITTTLAANYIPTASLVINLTPATGKWRIDGGTWRATGTTVGNLTPGNHTIDYNPVTGYIIPPAETVSLSSGQTTTLARSYVQLAQLTVTLSPTSGHWRIDGGTWRNSGATVTGITPGSHPVEYDAVSGYSSPATESVNLSAGQTLSLSRNYVQLAKIKVTLTPSSGQWRIDGGAWQASAVTATNVTIGSHVIDYSAQAGYLALAPETVSVTSGQTLTLSRTYVRSAQISVTLTPSSGLWCVDGGLWQASSAIFANLAPGQHAISYSSLTGYTSPATETVTLIAGQSLNFSRTYTQLAQISIGLIPATGKWRANGGAWQNAGSSLFVVPGSYLIEYFALSLYDSPANENIALAAGGIFSTTRSYTSQLPSLQIVTTGQWRVDGGAWLTSGVKQSDLSVGTHTIDYSDIGAMYETPPSETIALALRQNATLARPYVLKPSSIQINLEPNTGMWRASQNEYISDWQPSGAVVSGLRYSNYNIQYGLVANYDAPAIENAPVTPGQALILNRAYTPRAELTVTLTPSNGLWSIDGIWQNSGIKVSDLAPGVHTIAYSPLTNYTSPASETVNLASGQSLSLSRSYEQLAQISLTLVPASGQWRIVDTEIWQPSGATLSTPPGIIDIEYSDVADYDSPNGETISLAAGGSFTDTRYYTSQKPTLRINLTTAFNGPWQGQWRVDGGAWQNSNALVSDLSVGSHLVDYTDIGDPFNPLPSESISLGLRENASLARAYPLKPLASLTVTLDPASAQWNVDNGPWQANGATVGNLSYGNQHIINYAPASGYTTPASESVTLASGQVLALSRSYLQLAKISVTLTPTSGQWRVDGGAWQTSGTTVADLSPGPHTLSYFSLPVSADYATPASETVTLAVGQSLILSRSYTKLAAFYVLLNPSTAQWRIDGGFWSPSGIDNLRYGLSVGVHTVDYQPLAGYLKPPSETVTLVGGANAPISRSFIQLAVFGVSLTPSTAQWRLDGGAWKNSGDYLADLLPGTHSLEYSTAAGFITLPAESIVLVSGNNPPLSRSYTPLATFGVNLTPSSGQWRIDGGAWNNSGAFFTNLSLGAHTIEYSSVSGYVTLSTESVNLVSGINQPLVRSYTLLATFGVNLTPSSAQWRIDGGSWNNSGAFFTNLSLGTHTIEYSSLSGYLALPPETVTLVSGINQPLLRSYAKLASVHVSTTPSITQWRIDNGPWQMSGATTINSLAFGVPHTVEFLALDGYVTPPSQTFTLAVAEAREVTATYQKLASVHVSTTPSITQWRIDNGPWQSSGITTVNNLAFDVPHTVDFLALDGYVSPPSQTFTLAVAEAREITATYQKLASVHVSTTPSISQWRIDNGSWQSSGITTVNNLAFDVPHTVDFLALDGYVSPPSQTFTLAVAEVREITGTYQKLASVHVSTTPSISQWRIDNGSWQSSGITTINNLAFDVPHTVDFLALDGYVSPPSQTFTLAVAEAREITATYQKLASVHVSTTPSISQWRIDNGSWQSSGITTVNNLAFDLPHTVDFLGLNGYVTPASQTFTLAVAEMREVTATYLQLASLGVTLNLSSAQWRVDSGAWNFSGTTLTNLPPGNHTIDYSAVAGYTPPASEMIDLVGGYNPPLARSYTVSNPGSVTVTLTPSTAFWRISPEGSTSGSWNTSGTTVGNLIPGNYSLSYSVITGYDEPLTESITLADDENQNLLRNYAASVFATIATTRDAGGFNSAGTPAGTATTTCILGSDGYLYCAAYAEPAAGYGHIFRMAQDGTDYQELKRFGTDPADGFEPRALFEGSDGILYGCTKNSSFNSPVNQGTIFRINKDGSDYTILYTFVFASGGINPNSLIEGSDGVLYGTTENGGGSSWGTVFKINKNGSGYTVLSSLSISVGTNPQGIVEGPGGMLYGTSRYRGAGSNGTLFKLNKNGTGFAVFKSFMGGADGSTPCTSLLAGSDGVLYGTVSSGGSNNKGLIFRINADGSGYQNLHSFLGASLDGSDPETQLSEDASGILYGVTLTGGTSDNGTLFKLNKNGTGYTRIVNLTAGTNDGAWPRQRVVVSPSGKLFGADSIGGTLNNGLLFSVNSNGSAFTALHQNGTQYGAGPTYRIMSASNGSLFGTTTFGGGRRVGTLYRTTADGTAYTVLHNFNDATDGGLPLGQVIEASDGFLYGTTYGLQSADGTLYQIANDGSAYSVIHHFDGGANGKAVWSGVIEGSNGVLYGTCASGGNFDLGAVYRVNRDGSGFAVIHSFIGGATEGAAPKAELTQAADGRLFGTTSTGGAANLGTVFVLNQDGSGFVTLHQFSGGSSEGANPISPLRQGSDGNLYGTTQAVTGENAGTVYRVATDGSNYAVLKVFTGGTGSGSDPALSGVVEKAGKLYGTTAKGGTFDKGTIYSLNLDGSGYQIWINLGTIAADGTNPNSGLSIASNGMMYGTTYYGGRIASTWTIFRFVP